MAAALDIPLATAKQMAFKRRGLLSMGPQEIRGKVALLAQVGRGTSLPVCVLPRHTGPRHLPLAVSTALMFTPEPDYVTLLPHWLLMLCQAPST